MNYTSIFFLIFKNLWFLYLQWTLHDSKNAQTEMTKNTDQFWNMILSKQEEILRRETVLLLPLDTIWSEGDQIYYLGSITNVNDPHPQENRVESLPLLRLFPVYEQPLNWVYVCPWSPETAGPFCPSLELIDVDTPLTQAFWSLEVSTWHFSVHLSI